MQKNNPYNLISIYENRKDILEGIEKLNLLQEHSKFKVGQTISFNGGYNNDIRYISKIMGFNKEGGIYLLWDSYWYPIEDNETRKIELI